MGLKLSRTRPGRGLIRVNIEPDETLLGLKSSRARNGVKIKPDKAFLGLKSSRTSPGQAPDEARTRPGRGPDEEPLLGLISRPEMPVLSGPFYPVPFFHLWTISEKSNQPEVSENGIFS